MNASDRGRLIWRISELIEENADELAMLESLDNGKPYHIAKAADVALAADLFRYMAGWPTKIEGTTVPISALPARTSPTPCASRWVSSGGSSRGTSRC